MRLFTAGALNRFVLALPACACVYITKVECACVSACVRVCPRSSILAEITTFQRFKSFLNVYMMTPAAA